MNVVLIGFMGTGKSSIGKLLSAKLGYKFVDSDQQIEYDLKMSISDIFAKHGENYFQTSFDGLMRGKNYVKKWEQKVKLADTFKSFKNWSWFFNF